MRRTIFLALLAALLFAPVARATPPIEIQRDCADDGVLQGDYSASDLRKARSELPTDADEYSDCRDVLSRAIANATGSDSGGGWNPSAGGDDSGSTGGSPSSTPTPTPDAETGDTATPAESSTPAPTPTPSDDTLLAQAAKAGDQPVDVAGKAVSPGSSRLAAQVGRTGLPGTTVAVLVLLCLALLTAVFLPLLRRLRGGARTET
jgi:hypothetical protein